MNSQFGHQRDRACARIQPKEVFYIENNLKLLFKTDYACRLISPPWRGGVVSTRPANLLEMVRLEAESVNGHSNRENGGRESRHPHAKAI
jgi:hypothetical protein